MVQTKFGSKICQKMCLVKIGLITTEIFLILSNVARTNVAWTNVSVTVGSKEPTFNVWSESDQ